ncbi:uncharacterized protein UV8b_02096 [Ustilaginoidea virens]|uniref:Uncharacterized protein n=1 Tax=Ustilaginoidea virens TaxID=1159556 RepID=A0A1B5L2W1_USTVR|nr:uncharacterized protein UV8b_02096 [Ustilaginoidea virens]QUC17855.1 hypothetical protein UV8b_02096 [Ustilaginoidea virens]GAO17805.1 hypothetical protein UVI_02049290 [Ustilaginoidea virens]
MDASLSSRLLMELLPPHVATFAQQHLLNPRAPFQIYSQKAVSQLHVFLASLVPHVQPLLDRVAAAMVENQGVTGFVTLVLLMTAVVVVMNWIRRLVLWWTRLVMRVVFWTVVAAVLAWVWNRGVMESARDAVVLGAKVVGYLAVLKDFWMAEYKRYEASGSAGGRPSDGGFGSPRGRSSGR